MHIQAIQALQKNKNHKIKKNNQFDVQRMIPSYCAFNSIPKIDQRSCNYRSVSQIATNKANPLNSHNNQEHDQINQNAVNFSKKYEWIHQNVEYGQHTSEEIMKENKKLKKSLLNLNLQINRLMNGFQPKAEKNTNLIVSLKNKKKVKTQADVTLPHKLSLHRFDLQNREVVNNESIIKIYQQEYNKLKERQQYVSATDDSLLYSNENVHKLNNSQHCSSIRKEKLKTEIHLVKEDIERTKKENKDIKKKNRSLQKGIGETDEMLEDLRRLMKQIQLQRKHKLKLDEKVQKTELSIDELNEKLKMIKPKQEQAESCWKVFQQQQKTKLQQKKNEEELRKKKYTIQMINYKKQKILQSKRVAYNKLLKQLEQKKQLIDYINNKIYKVQQNNIYMQNLRYQLQQQYHQIKLQKQRTSQRVNQFNNYQFGQISHMSGNNQEDDDDDLLAPFLHYNEKKIKKNAKGKTIVNQQKKGCSVKPTKNAHQCNTPISESLMCRKKQSKTKPKITFNQNTSLSVLERGKLKLPQIQKRQHKWKQYSQQNIQQNGLENEFQFQSYDSWQKQYSHQNSKIIS